MEILAGETDNDGDREIELDDQYAHWLNEQNGSDDLGQNKGMSWAALGRKTLTGKGESAEFSGLKRPP